MQQALSTQTSPPESPTGQTDDRPESNVSATELLELLGDEYTHQVLGAVLERPRTGRELVEATDVSKATVYRRLDRLQAAGIVDARLELDTNGHHRKQFHATAESIQVGLGPDGFAASVEFGEDSRLRGVSSSDD